MHRFDLGAWPRKKIQNNKKVTKVLYFPYLGGAPAEPIWFKNCMLGGLHYIITCAKFQIDIYRCYDFTGGRIFDFPIDFLDGPYHSAALMRCVWSILREKRLSCCLETFRIHRSTNGPGRITLYFVLNTGSTPTSLFGYKICEWLLAPSIECRQSTENECYHIQGKR